MKLREHEQIVGRIHRSHRMEVANLNNQIAVLKETVELLRLRAQKAEAKQVEIFNCWVADYELTEQEKEMERVPS